MASGKRTHLPIQETLRATGLSSGKDSLEKGMAMHSSLLAWRIPRDRGAWRTPVQGISKSWTQLKQLSTHIAD